MKVSNKIISEDKKTHTYSVSAIIYLKDLHPMFENMPISRALNYKIQIFWNHQMSTSTSTYATGTATTFGAKTLTYENGSSSFNGSNPIEFDVGLKTPQAEAITIESTCTVDV